MTSCSSARLTTMLTTQRARAERGANRDFPRSLGVGESHQSIEACGRETDRNYGNEREQGAAELRLP